MSAAPVLKPAFHLIVFLSLYDYLPAFLAVSIRTFMTGNITDINVQKAFTQSHGSEVFKLFKRSLSYILEPGKGEKILLNAREYLCPVPQKSKQLFPSFPSHWNYNLE